MQDSWNTDGAFSISALHSETGEEVKRFSADLLSGFTDDNDTYVSPDGLFFCRFKDLKTSFFCCEIFILKVQVNQYLTR